MVKKGRIITFFIVVLALAGLIAYTVTDTTKNIKLGLDLQGGFEVLYEVETVKEDQEINSKTLDATVEAIRSRIDVLGVSEPNVDIEGENRIRVQLAGIEDQNQARELLSTQAQLSFRDVNDTLMLDGADLQEGGASLTFSETNQPWVSLTLKDADKFGAITKEISERPLGENLLVIWLDYQEGDSFQEEVQKENPKFLSAPRVSEVLNTKNVVIQGDFTVEEATNLSNLLNAGSLPVKLKEIYSTSVGAQFGEKALEKTIFAGIIGIAVIFLYMIFYYRFPGIIAVLTLSVYIYLILVVFDWMNAVLTLPGIAALILGVGMAVDANIITYERVKEEIKSGKTILSAFKAGSRRSFATIFDANITTLIAAGVLFAFGTSSVKGFAVMLITSILVSFITAVYGSRLLLGLWVKSRILNKKPGYFGVKESEINEL
ncbi:protein translocase subunit SecD [Bacillus taeanensis]|uniref:protein translocase subunit SecD n=1 Tax=Bacillus taeanensis TaxID=273032 RepID=UPI0015F0D252|nr:protein translocase subunit SecD [Bacillus taeanensis]